MMTPLGAETAPAARNTGDKASVGGQMEREAETEGGRSREEWESERLERCCSKGKKHEIWERGKNCGEGNRHIVEEVEQ